jgi:hypothetical protein
VWGWGGGGGEAARIECHQVQMKRVNTAAACGKCFPLPRSSPTRF